MPGWRRFVDEAEERPERPADPAVRKANTRRIVRLFRPYRRRLGSVCTLIVVSAVLGALPAFLLREVLDVDGHPRNARVASSSTARLTIATP